MNPKLRLWQASGKNMYKINIAAANIGLTVPCDNDNDYEKILLEMNRMKETPIETKLYPVAQIEATIHNAKQRYSEAHLLNFKTEYPQAYKDGFYSPPVFPKVQTSNGFNTFIVNFITWNGFRATRINVQGRLIEQPQKQTSGISLMTKKYMHSTTRKGSADISSTIRGKSVQWETKIGKDKPSGNQIKEQYRERRAGGEYFFVHNTDEFLTLFDSLIYG